MSHKLAILIGMSVLASLSICCTTDADLHVIVPPPAAAKPALPPLRPSDCPTTSYATGPDGQAVIQVKTYPRFQLDQEDTVSLPQDPSMEPGQDNVFRMPFLHLDVTSACGKLTMRRLTVALMPAADATWTTTKLPTKQHPNGGDPLKSGFLSTMSWEGAPADGTAMKSFNGEAQSLGDAAGSSVFWSFDFPSALVNANDRMRREQIFLFQIPPQLIPPRVTFDLMVLDADWTDEESGTPVNGDRSMEILSTIVMSD